MNDHSKEAHHAVRRLCSRPTGCQPRELLGLGASWPERATTGQRPVEGTHQGDPYRQSRHVRQPADPREQFRHVVVPVGRARVSRLPSRTRSLIGLRLTLHRSGTESDHQRPAWRRGYVRRPQPWTLRTPVERWSIDNHVRLEVRRNGGRIWQYRASPVARRRVPGTELSAVRNLLVELALSPLLMCPGGCRSPGGRLAPSQQIGAARVASNGPFRKHSLVRSCDVSNTETIVGHTVRDVLFDAESRGRLKKALNAVTFAVGSGTRSRAGYPSTPARRRQWPCVRSSTPSRIRDAFRESGGMPPIGPCPATVGRRLTLTGCSSETHTSPRSSSATRASCFLISLWLAIRRSASTMSCGRSVAKPFARSRSGVDWRL